MGERVPLAAPGRLNVRLLAAIRPFHGHFHPLAPVVAAARAAGHEVAFATERSFCAVVERSGFPAFPAGLDPWAPAPYEGFEFSAEPTRAKTADMLRIGESWPPDLVLRDPTDFGALVGAEALGVPHATLGFSLFCPTWWWQRVLGTSLDEVRAEHGLPLDPGFERLYPWLYLDTVPPWFQRFVGVSRDRLRMVRPELFEAPAPDGASGFAFDSRRPTVLVTFGTVFNARPDLLALLCRGAAAADANVLCVVGPGQDPAGCLGRQPDLVQAAAYVPLSEVLPRCDAVIAHGGYNTMLAALLHRLPLLLVPLGADNALNAERCVELGVALMRRPEDLSQPMVASLVRRLLDEPHWAEAAGRLAARTAALPGPERAVELLERIAVGRRRQPQLAPPVLNGGPPSRLPAA